MTSDRFDESGDELRRFKEDINLVEFAVGRGYEIRPGKSTRTSKRLTHPGTGHKIVVSKDAEHGHWIYYTVGDGARSPDSGTIVDFLAHRGGGRVGRAVFDELRRWQGLPERDFTERREHVVAPAAPPDRERVDARYRSADIVENSLYLHLRGLKPSTLQQPMFQGTWRQDRAGNVLFVHRDREGISGYEIKGAGVTMFSAGGCKSLWYSKPPRDGWNELIVAESAIDALSHYQLHPRKDAVYMSTGGHVGRHQINLLASAADKLPDGGRVRLALDADLGGDQIYEALKAPLGKPHVQVLRDSPTMAKDWNAALQAREVAFIARVRNFTSQLGCEIFTGRIQGLELSR